MATGTIDHTTLTKLVEEGVVQSAHAIAQDGGWGLLVKYGETERALTVQRSHQVRIFRGLEALMNYLKGVGIQHFDVDSANYDPDSATIGKRSERATAIKESHPTATYNNWLDAEVQEAIDDTSPTVPHDEAMRQVRAAIKNP